jgi:ribonuclease Z
VDCAEGTQVQLLKATVPKASKISKIFITHLHGLWVVTIEYLRHLTTLLVDHCCGIVPFMNSVMTSAHNPGKPSKLDDTVDTFMSFAYSYNIHGGIQLRLELYGPSGLRKLVRTNLQITQTLLRGKYAAHELLFEGDAPTICGESDMHQNEIPGRDIRINADGRWNHFEDSHGVRVDAAPIVHRGNSSYIRGN